MICRVPFSQSVPMVAKSLAFGELCTILLKRPACRSCHTPKTKRQAIMVLLIWHRCPMFQVVPTVLLPWDRRKLHRFEPTYPETSFTIRPRVWRRAVMRSMRNCKKKQRHVPGKSEGYKLCSQYAEIQLTNPGKPKEEILPNPWKSKDGEQ